MGKMMRAVEISEPGGPDVLKPADLPRPEAGPGEVLIAVSHAGVNRPDVLQRIGAYPVPAGASPLPGLEVAGHIASIGEGVRNWKEGDAVCALTPGGGYAEFVTAPAGHCLPVPKGLSLEQAAALPETVFTVWHNVFQRGALQPGERLLVHGGSSGIGTIAIQIATALGSEVFITAGSAEKCEACVKLGAKRGINYKDEDFVGVVKVETEGRGVDVVLDMVGGDYTARNIACTASDGRIVQIAFLRGPKAEIDLNRLMRERITLTGSTLRPRSDAFKADLAKAVLENVWPLVEAGKVAPVMHASFPLEEAAAAHTMMEESGHIGKITLTI